MLERIAEFTKARADFAFETALSSDAPRLIFKVEAGKGTIIDSDL